MEELNELETLETRRPTKSFWNKILQRPLYSKRQSTLHYLWCYFTEMTPHQQRCCPRISNNLMPHNSCQQAPSRASFCIFETHAHWTQEDQQRAFGTKFFDVRSIQSGKSALYYLWCFLPKRRLTSRDIILEFRIT